MSPPRLGLAEKLTAALRSGEYDKAFNCLRANKDRDGGATACMEQEEKYELLDGYVYPLFGDRTALGFAGATGSDGRLAIELAILIGLAARPCRTYGSAVQIETARSTRYADLFVTCDDRERNDSLVMRHPKPGALQLTAIPLIINLDDLYAIVGIRA